MATSFLSPAEAADINADLRDLFATTIALGPTVNLLLYRDSAESGQEIQKGPTTVLVRYADRKEQASAGPAGGVTESDGTFAAWAPWNVEQGDRFVMPTSGTRGRITLVEEPANGIQRARFALAAGG